MRNFAISLAALAAISLVGPPPARSESITYKMQATASGTLGGTAFINSLVTIWATGDTDDVAAGGTADHQFLLSNVAYSGSIAGLGNFEILGSGTIDVRTFATASGRESGGIGFNVFDGSNGVFGKNIFGMSSFPLAGYELKAPIVAPAWNVVVAALDNDFKGFGTTAGKLVFTGVDPASGVFTATTAAVPEPTGLVMLALGVGAVITLRRTALTAIPAFSRPSHRS
ncbi:hypothetical protein OJF2_68270 [Aquisphaera giovannonii]|uniref:PEP-CTERM protein-sorting domain-containing protein n=1 Tax=Aquisphaera giovannonii TaxID=406548 RepID=A0A5B9WDB9_9BACT|nr:PEP-CTERM sorting domain-containing protein [Aquisphaera giovannonii]QEH38229.1 hypothetical protein OJF2_68270 [Aquisphaera giovannonii]